MTRVIRSVVNRLPPGLRRFLVALVPLSVIVGRLFGVPTDVTELVAPSVGLVEALASREPARGADQTKFTAERADAYRRYANAVVALVGDTSLLMNTKPPLIPNIWRLAPLWRASRDFQADYRRMFEALSDIRLYADDDTFTRALDATMVIGEHLTILGRTGRRPGSAEAVASMATASTAIGDGLTGFRRAARSDLGLAPFNVAQPEIEGGEQPPPAPEAQAPDQHFSNSPGRMTKERR